MPNPKGFSVANLMLTLLQSTKVSLSTGLILTLTFAPGETDLQTLQSYAIDADESLQISLVNSSLFSATSTCVPALPMTLGYVDVIAQDDAALETAAKTMYIVATAAVATGAAIGSSAAALDAQSLVIMGFMSCASPMQRVLLRHARVLSPAAIDDSLEGMIYGNLIIFFGVFALQACLVFVVRQVRNVNTKEAMGMCRFPSFTILILTLTFEGQGAIGLNLIVESGGDAVKIVVGLVGVLCCAIVIPAIHLLAHYSVSAGFATYNLQRTQRSRLPPKIVQMLLPRGRWQPKSARQAYGVVMTNIGREEKIWVSAHLWGPLTMVIGTAFRPSSTATCVAQYSVLSVLQFLIAIVILAKRPYRSTVSNILATCINVCFGMFLAGTAAATSREGDDGRRTTLVGIQMIIGVTALRILHSLCIFVLEHLGSVTKIPMDEEFFWIGSRSSRIQTGIDMTGLSADDVQVNQFDALLDERSEMDERAAAVNVRGSQRPALASAAPAPAASDGFLSVPSSSPNGGGQQSTAQSGGNEGTARKKKKKREKKSDKRSAGSTAVPIPQNEETDDML